MPMQISGVTIQGGMNILPAGGSPTPSPTPGGVSYGYTSGAYPPNATIDKFPFASDGNATDVGNLTVARGSLSGQSSSTNGYSSGGYDTAASNVIDKFPFASDSDATDVGNLLAGNYNSIGQSSTDNGYASGGSTGTLLNTIQKFPFSSDANSADAADLTLSVSSGAGQSSSTHGYASGGYDGPSSINNIQKFTFSSDSNATDVGDITVVRYRASGQSSSVSGYSSAGYDSVTGGPAGYTNIIDKFSFSSDGNATDVGDLTQNISNSAGQSATDSGYASGGQSPSLSPNDTNVINKFPFSSDSNATDVGDLTQARSFVAGQQG